MGFFEFRRQLEYKARRRGGTVVVADPWFASSKMCSVCGGIRQEMPLSARHWTCPVCGTYHERDLNAARNLAAYAVSSTVSACGGEGAGAGCDRRETGPAEAGSQRQKYVCVGLGRSGGTEQMGPWEGTER